MTQNRIVLSEPKIKEKENYVRISAILKFNGKRKELWFDIPKKFLNKEQVSSAFLNAVYIPCLAIGGKIISKGEVSPKLLSNLPTVGDIMKTWFPSRFKKQTDFVARHLSAKNPQGKKVGLFFTLGVDSMTSLMKHLKEVDYLIYVLDEQTNLYPKDGKIIKSHVPHNIEKVANLYGKEVIEIGTNLKEFAKEFTDWPSQYHGSMFASIAILLSKTIGKFYLASSHAYPSMINYGSHPALDYLFEVEGMRFIHDGAELTRVGKVKMLSEYPDCLPFIDYGCGGVHCTRHQKCIRTLLNFDLCGILDKLPQLKHGYTVNDIKNLPMAGESDFSKAKENYKELAKHPKKAHIRTALKVAMQRYKDKRHAAGYEWE